MVLNSQYELRNIAEIYAQRGCLKYLRQKTANIICKNNIKLNIQKITVAANDPVALAV